MNPTIVNTTILLLLVMLISQKTVGQETNKEKQEPKGLAVGDTVQNFQAIDADSTLYVFNEMIKKSRSF